MGGLGSPRVVVTAPWTVELSATGPQAHRPAGSSLGSCPLVGWSRLDSWLAHHWDLLRGHWRCSSDPHWEATHCSAWGRWQGPRGVGATVFRVSGLDLEGKLALLRCSAAPSAGSTSLSTVHAGRGGGVTGPQEPDVGRGSVVWTWQVLE